MLTSLAFIFLSGFMLGALVNRMRLPRLLGMMLAGILLGPYALGLLDPSILSISADLRRLALVIILSRAGLSFNIDALRRVGRPAVLLCFVPACFEIAGMLLLAPALLGISLLDAALMGAVVAAVSPAVVVPKMLDMMEKGYGSRKCIPQMIMAGASVDDVFVIVLFGAFLSLSAGDYISGWVFAEIPVSILLGIALGVGCGYLLALFFRRVKLNAAAKVVVFLSIAFLLLAAEELLQGMVPLSGLLAVMGMGAAVFRREKQEAEQLSVRFASLWVAAEVLLFALVGAAVNVRFALSAGAPAVLLVLGALVFRAAGVLVSVLGTALTWRERLFCMIAYCPKATVQAAIGSIPLSMGLASGEIILTVSVLSILITAPLGALGIDLLHGRLLECDGGRLR